jgi:hypothetical protein
MPTSTDSAQLTGLAPVIAPDTRILILGSFRAPRHWRPNSTMRSALCVTRFVQCVCKTGLEAAWSEALTLYTVRIWRRNVHFARYV